MSPKTVKKFSMFRERDLVKMSSNGSKKLLKNEVIGQKNPGRIQVWVALLKIGNNVELEFSLKAAVKNGNEDIVQVLVPFINNVNKFSLEMSPIQWAIVKGHRY